MLCPTVVGREQQLGRLRERLERARRGDGGVVVVAGEAGVGKSRLLAELVAEARGAGDDVRIGRAVERVTTPLRPLAEALIATAGDANGSGSVSALAPLWSEREPIPGGGSDRLALAQAIVGFLEERARPSRSCCLVVLEDLHWADTETFEVVDYFADHLRHVPVLCVAAVRTGEGSTGDRWLVDVAVRRVAEIVELRPLEHEDVAAMTAACLGSSEVPDDLVAFLDARTDGLPLAVEELLAGLVADDALVRDGERWRVVSRLSPRVPVTLVESVGRRMRRLAPADASVVEAAAVLGRTFDWSLLPAVTARDEAEVLAALRRARDVQLIGVDEYDRFEFRHALTRDAVVQTLLPPERSRLASRSLDVLEAAHPQLEGELCEVGASLAKEAGRFDRASTLLLESSRRALARGALVSAGEALAGARALDPDRNDSDVAEVGAELAALTGEVDEALRLTATALAAAGDEPRRARLHLVLARALLAAGRSEQAGTEAARAAELVASDTPVDRANPRPLLAAAHAVEALAAVASGDLDAARDLAARAVAESEQSGAWAAACEALEVLGRIARIRDVGEAERYFERGRSIAERHGLHLWRARALAELGTVDLLTTCRKDRLIEARQAAPPGLLAVVDLHLSSVGHARWEPKEAYEAAARCVELSRRLGLATLGMGLIHLATSAALCRRPDAEVEDLVSEALAVSDGAVDVVAGVPGRVRFTHALVRADLRAARAALDEAVAVLRAEPAVGFPFRGMWALLQTVAGDDGEACREEASSGAAGSVPVNAAPIDMARAVALGRAGRVQGAQECAAAAFDRLAGQQGAGVWAAILRLIAAPAAHEDGWGDGAAWLRLALSVFENTGERDLAAAARARLSALGVPVPRRGRGEAHVPAALRAMNITSREVDVLLLVSEGLTNREIASRLSLSHRTVDRHIANVLTKTGAADRRAAATMLEMGVASP